MVSNRILKQQKKNNRYSQELPYPDNKMSDHTAL